MNSSVAKKKKKSSFQGKTTKRSIKFRDRNGLDLTKDLRDPNPIGSDLGQFKMNLDRIWTSICGSRAGPNLS